MTGSFSNFDPAAPGRLLYYSSFVLSIVSLFNVLFREPLPGSAKNVAKVGSIFETCKFFRNFFFEAPPGPRIRTPGHPGRGGNSFPKASAKVRNPAEPSKFSDGNISKKHAF